MSEASFQKHPFISAALPFRHGIGTISMYTLQFRLASEIRRRYIFFMKQTPRSIIVTARVTPKLLRQLEKAAREDGVSMSLLIATALANLAKYRGMWHSA